MTMTFLFDPISLRGVTVKNRIWVSPMCQYSVQQRDGIPTDWHFVHLGSRAVGGFGLIITEATAVTADGRISPEDTGLWNSDQVEAWRRIVDFVHAQDVRIGVQLGHAGRKSSTFAPWLGKNSVPVDQGGWQSVAPSSIAFGDYAEPRALTVGEIDEIVTAFSDAARRATQAGFDLVEIHAAHGYLAHQFLSPLSNHRTDEYGGSFSNRVRFLLRVVAAVRDSIADDVPVVVRISGTDWVEGGWTIQDSTELALLLAERGVDLIDVSSGGLHPAQKITVGPGYQVPFARDVRTKADIPTGAVGLISEPAQAQAILDEGSADVVLLARAALREPAWPLRAAHELGVPAADAPYPAQYTRAAWR
jgi:2,4-dienoyl-CoA reductase-like NADH-dependent reductase (Old Yellow Enzyme family)